MRTQVMDSKGVKAWRTLRRRGGRTIVTKCSAPSFRQLPKNRRTSSTYETVPYLSLLREARKGKPLPSDHAPLVIDLDKAGHPFDADRTSEESRIAARLPKQR
jgi:hypothetical protein